MGPSFISVCLTPKRHDAGSVAQADDYGGNGNTLCHRLFGRGETDKGEAVIEHADEP